MARLTPSSDDPQRRCGCAVCASNGRSDRGAAALEVLDRATSAARALEQITTGRWMADAETLDAVALLVGSAARWARRADNEEAA